MFAARARRAVVAEVCAVATAKGVVLAADPAALVGDVARRTARNTSSMLADVALPSTAPPTAVRHEIPQDHPAEPIPSVDQSRGFRNEQLKFVSLIQTDLDPQI